MVTRLGPSDGAELPHVSSVDLHFVSAVIQFAIQSGMHTRQMIALQIVIHVRLPIAVHLVATPLKKLHLREWMSPGLLRQTAHAGIQRFCIVVQIHEYQVGPLCDADRAEREMLRPERLNPFELSRTNELPIEAISPAVVAAAKYFSRATSLGRRPRPMTAYVMEATRFKVVISHQQQGFAGQFHREVIPRLGQLIAVSDYLPCAMK